jgi:hypothetical protein
MFYETEWIVAYKQDKSDGVQEGSGRLKDRHKNSLIGFLKQEILVENPVDVTFFLHRKTPIFSESFK